MNTKKKQAVKRQRAAWVQGQSLTIPEKRTAYERELIRLGLEEAPIEQLVASEELRAFAVRVRNERYLPEILLHRWGLHTCWEGKREDSRHLPKFSLYDAQQACSAPAQ